MIMSQLVPNMSTTPVKGKENTRSLLIETGIDIMLEKGFNNTGLSEVLGACKVPKGSFYYYFQSKEDFGLQIINTFDEKYVLELDRVLGDKSLSAVERLTSYINESIAKAEQRKCSRGCLIANLSQEMADQNEVFRNRLKEIIEKRRSAIALVMQEGMSIGEISADLNAQELAEFFLSAFEGAILRAKVKKSTESLHVFKKMMFDKLFKYRQDR